MVVLVGHTLLLRGVSLDVNDISNAVGDKVCREFNGALLWKLWTVQNRSPNAEQIYSSPLNPRLNMSRVRAR